MSTCSNRITFVLVCISLTGRSTTSAGESPKLQPDQGLPQASAAARDSRAYYVIDGYLPPGNHPDPTNKAACAAIRRNFNYFSHYPPRYRHHTLDRRVRDLQAPHWEALDPRTHFDLVVKADLGPSGPASDTAAVAWRKTKLQEQLGRGELTLDRADLDFDSDGTIETLYRLRFLDGGGRDRPPTNKGIAPRYFVAMRGSTERPKSYQSHFAAPTGDLWQYLHNRWYVINYDDLEHRYVVSWISNVDRTTPGLSPLCAISRISNSKR